MKEFAAPTSKVQLQRLRASILPEGSLQSVKCAAVWKSGGVFFFIYHLAGRVLLLDIKELPTAALGNNNNKKARKTSKTRFKFPKLKRDQSQEDEKKGQSFALDSPSGCTEAGEFPLFDCKDTSGPQVVCVFELRSRESERERTARKCFISASKSPRRNVGKAGELFLPLER